MALLTLHSPAAALALVILLVGVTGPSVSLLGLAWWWSAIEVICCLLCVFFLALTCYMDPGALPQHACPDSLIPQLDDYVRRTGGRIVEIDGLEYACSPSGFWSRYTVGVHTLPLAMPPLGPLLLWTAPHGLETPAATSRVTLDRVLAGRAILQLPSVPMRRASPLFASLGVPGVWHCLSMHATATSGSRMLEASIASSLDTYRCSSDINAW